MTQAWTLGQAVTDRLAELESYTLQPSGLVVMLLSVGFVTGLLAWCIRRVTRETRPEKLHGHLDVDTQDAKT